MYRKILGFFGGAVPEGPDENQELNQKSNHSSENSDMASIQEFVSLKNHISKLEKELNERTEENENNKTQICSMEKELTKLKEVTKQQAEKISIGVGDSGVTEQDSPGQDVEKLTKENNDLRTALCKSAELLKDKTEVCDNQEKRNTALTLQIASLKEVITITKDLLNIRNMEVKHLQSDVDSMESKIAEEKQRHNAMIGKLNDAVKLNSNLKQEYEMQLKIFQDLKSKYEEKVALLLRENQKQKISNSALQPESVNSTVAPE